MSKVAESPAADRQQQVVRRRCRCGPVVQSGDDMETAAVEAVNTARDCGSQRPCLRCVREGGAYGQLVSPQFEGARETVVVPDVRQGTESRLCNRHAVLHVCVVSAVTLESHPQVLKRVDVLEGVLVDVDMAEQSLGSTFLLRLRGFVG